MNRNYYNDKRKCKAARKFYLKKEYNSAFELYFKLAEVGYWNCQVAIAEMYQSGTGVSQSYTKAQYWFEKAALDNSNAIYQLAICCYKQGDVQNAISILEQGDLCGDGLCSYGLGILYQKGVDVTKDIEKSKYYFSRASSFGNVFGSLKILGYRRKNLNNSFINIGCLLKGYYKIALMIIYYLIDRDDNRTKYKTRINIPKKPRKSAEENHLKLTESKNQWGQSKAK